MSRYTMELGKLVGSGYEIFDDSWTTFVEMHKKELCDKIIRHYFFYEIIKDGILLYNDGRKLLTDSSTI